MAFIEVLGTQLPLRSPATIPEELAPSGPEGLRRSIDLMIHNPWVLWRRNPAGNDWDLLLVTASQGPQPEKTLLWIRSPFRNPRIQILGGLEVRTPLETPEGESISPSGGKLFPFRLAVDETCDGMDRPWVAHPTLGLLPILTINGDCYEFTEVETRWENLKAMPVVAREEGFIFLQFAEVIGKSAGGSTLDQTRGRIVAVLESAWKEASEAQASAAEDSPD